MKASIQVEHGNTLKSLQGFLRMLLEAGVVEALLVPLRAPWGTVAPALVVDPDQLEAADPLAPVMPVNSAALAGKLTARKPHARIGAVLRACEVRALVELAKMQQASLEDMTLIVVDCAGTYPGSKDEVRGDEGKGGWLELFREATNHSELEALEQKLRPACRICEQPVYEGTLPVSAQISIELFGCDPLQEIRVSLPNDVGERLGITLIKTPIGEASGGLDEAPQLLRSAEPAEGASALPGQADRLHVLENLVAARIARRDAEIAAIQARLEGEEKLAGVMEACIRCHNCMTVCPICYCKTCVFRSPLFDHDPEQYLKWAEAKGACRLPADGVLFHLTRMSHMALSCVGCGMCSEACPADLPVGLVFRAVGRRLQETFDYLPGRSINEPLPLVTFKADEWTEVGE